MMRRLGRRCWMFVVLFICLPLQISAAQGGRIAGNVIDQQGLPLPSATIGLFGTGNALLRQTTSDQQGRFEFDSVEPGTFHLDASAPGFKPVSETVRVSECAAAEVHIQFADLSKQNQSVNVTAHISPVATSDPAAKLYNTNQILPANPGRPGAPFSIPGLPIETASGGIKAPQYFAPGVAGDHGEPIAQFFRIGDYLFPNNLPANAHGNGYSDPNVVVPATVNTVETDAGAFSVQEGNHAVDLGVTYGIRNWLSPFVQISGDQHDGDLTAAWGPENPSNHTWLALETSFGNGFLKRPERRQQYKLDGYRGFTLGRHELSLYSAGYYGFSYIPGLIPTDTLVGGDTIDPRQLDRTHNLMLVATDTWQINSAEQFAFSGFFRAYALTLRSNFGNGLIQQSESRTVAGGNATYSYRIRRGLSLLAGTDLRRDAPRNLDLKHLDSAGAFDPVTENNLTLSFLEPYISLDGNWSSHFHYDFGVRQEAIRFNNQDLLRPQNSFGKLSSFSLPKASVTLFPSDHSLLPSLGLSYGSAFHTEDPRIGTATGGGIGSGSIIAHAGAYQLFTEKEVKRTTLRLTLARVTNSAELAKIDADTGLQEDVGPSRTYSLTASAKHYFDFGSLYFSFSRADSRDRLVGQPVPEAPRLIWDTLGNVGRLPWNLHAQGEFEYVGATLLGNGFVGRPIREFRGALLRSFEKNRLEAGINFLIAGGYTGQTLEIFALAGEPAPFERIVGVPLKSYVALSFVYRPSRRLGP